MHTFASAIWVQSGSRIVTEYVIVTVALYKIIAREMAEAVDWEERRRAGPVPVESLNRKGCIPGWADLL